MRVGDGDDVLARSTARLNFGNVLFKVCELLLDDGRDLMQGLAVERPVAAKLVHALDHAPGDNQHCRDGEQNHDERTESARHVPIFQKDRKSTRLNSSHVEISYA